MSHRAYKVILILLGFCVFTILLIQAFWIRNLYLQKKEQFGSAVYTSLEEITGRMRENEQLRVLDEEYNMLPSKNGTRLKVIRKNKREREVMLMNERTDVRRNGDSLMVEMETSGGGGHITTMKKVIISDDSSDAEVQELELLVHKMLGELKTNGKNMNGDSLQLLIKSELGNKGLFTPFEFCLRGEGNKELRRSTGFKPDAPYYRMSLSSKKILPDPRELLLQFPGEDQTVLGGMKNSILLSAIFSLVIMMAFYYTLRLIRKQKEISEIRNDFVNNMTHELKTPIATISLAVEALSNPMVKNNEAMFREYSRILKEENEKLGKHVDSVLQISLIEKGKLQLRISQVDVGMLVSDCIKAYRLKIYEKNAEVIFVSPPAAVLINGDEAHLRSVFSNLLDNALKFSGDNCRIEFKIIAGKEEVTVTVTDNGIGIDADEREKIFDKFYRVHSGELHDVKGFGLGLSYARSIVEAHGGNITVAGMPGKGSAFTVKLRYDA